jgi:hypothetical protein
MKAGQYTKDFSTAVLRQEEPLDEARVSFAGKPG